MKKEYVQVCPECGSENITITDYPNISAPMSLGAMCKNCGHKGIFVEVEMSKLKNFRKKIKKKDDKVKIKLEEHKQNFFLNPYILVPLFSIVVTIIIVIVLSLTS